MKIFRRDRCYNGGSRHKFEARYSEKSSGRTIGKSRGYGPDDFKKILNLNVYEYDICVWCGKIKTNV